MRGRRAELRDIFRAGDESVVMAGANVVRLSELATFLLGQMSEWRTSDELATVLADRFGDPAEGDAVGLVEAALAELADLKIVEVQE